MIIVTGAAGFIGSNIIKRLNEDGHTNIIAVDDLTNGHKFKNLVDLEIADYMDKDVFLNYYIDDIQVMFHNGANSSTTEWNGKEVMKSNYDYSKAMHNMCRNKGAKFIYASSASVYGLSRESEEIKAYEKPINMYAYSKMLFDNYMRKNGGNYIGLRYFNVYGPREQHKEDMASAAYKFNQSLSEGKKIKLFKGSDKILRDFIHVDDVVNVNMWAAAERSVRGIFNVGTGEPKSFEDVAKCVINGQGNGIDKFMFNDSALVDYAEIVPMPEKLKGCYQYYTKANIDNLRKAGYDKEFKSLQVGIGEYMQWLNK